MAARLLLLRRPPWRPPPAFRAAAMGGAWRVVGRRALAAQASAAAAATAAAAVGESEPYSLERLRNVGIIAHIDAGKTTTTERILFLAGATGHVGEVDTGDTVMDFLPQERERGITIQSAAISLDWGGHRVNLIDTPGHVDFTMEVERAVRVLDGAVVVLDAVAGVQAQTETVWRQARKYAVPAVAFVNKMDREGADFPRAVASLKRRLRANAVPIQLPIGDGAEFVGAVDLLTMERVVWEQVGGSGGGGKGKRPEVKMARYPLDDQAAPPSLREAAKAARASMLEAVAEADEAFMEVYLEAVDSEEGDASLPLPAILAALRRACVAGALVPVLCGASLKGRGVEPLLDSVLAFLPSPLDRPVPVARKRSVEDKEQKAIAIHPRDPHLCAYAFKVTHDRQRGLIVFLRVYSGTLHGKGPLHNSTRGAKERPLQLLEVRADDLTPVERAGSGQTVAAVGLKETYTGDTLVAYKGPLHGATLDGVSIPAPVFALAVEPVSSAKQQALEEALAIMQREDPSLRVSADAESGQLLLRGVGELHLGIVCDRLRRAHNVAVETGEAYVAYREGISGGPVVHATAYERQVGGRRLFAALRLRLEPAAEGAQAAAPEVSLDKAAAEALNAEERASLLEGLADACQRGPLAGYPVAGFHVHVESVERDGDTTPGALRACSVAALAEAMRASGAVLLEPVMRVEVLAPEASFGQVLSDLTVARRGAVREVDGPGSEAGDALGGGKHVIHADVPLAALLGYATALRSITQGEGSFSMEFSHYAPASGGNEGGPGGGVGR